MILCVRARKQVIRQTKFLKQLNKPVVEFLVNLHGCRPLSFRSYSHRRAVSVCAGDHSDLIP